MNLYAYFIYFQTLIAPSLLLEIRSLWFNLTEANERMESRWQPAESVAAAARTCFAVNLAVKCRLFVSCLQGKSSNFSIKNPILCTLKIWKLCDCIMKRSKESEQKKLHLAQIAVMLTKMISRRKHYLKYRLWSNQINWVTP
jgi:hypothetical protein